MTNPILNHLCVPCISSGLNIHACLQWVVSSSRTQWRWNDQRGLVARDGLRSDLRCVRAISTMRWPRTNQGTADWTGRKNIILIRIDVFYRNLWTWCSYGFPAIKGANSLAIWCRQILQADGDSMCRTTSFRISCVHAKRNFNLMVRESN